MKTVQVGFSIPKDHPFPIFSWAIRYFESDNFWSFTNISHAYVRWPFGNPAEGIDNTYEASGSSLHFLGNEVFEAHIKPVEIYEVDMESEAFKSALKFCIRNAGKDYGIKGALRLALPSLKRKFTGKHHDTKYNDGEQAQFCSEVVGRFLEAAGVIRDVNVESLGVNELRMLMRSLDKSHECIRRIK